jgi:hypothetical protein
MVESRSESLFDKLLEVAQIKYYNIRALERNTEELFSVSRRTTMLLLRTLFNNYNKSVKIVGSSLCSKILADEDCRKRLDMFESPARIILTNFPNYEGEKIKNYFFNNMNSRVSIKEIKSFLTSKFETGEKEGEFLVLDDIAYFFEHDLKSGEKGARCSFYNLKGALHLSKTFDDIYNKH